MGRRPLFEVGRAGVYFTRWIPAEETTVDAGSKLEIQNLTSLPLTWAHVAYEDGRTGAPEVNLLSEVVLSRKGVLLENLPPGRGRLICGFHGAWAGLSSVRSDAFELGSDAAVVASVSIDASAGFKVQIRDGRRLAPAGAGTAQGYTWSKILGPAPS